MIGHAQALDFRDSLDLAQLAIARAQAAGDAALASRIVAAALLHGAAEAHEQRACREAPLPQGITP